MKDGIIIEETLEVRPYPIPLYTTGGRDEDGNLIKRISPRKSPVSEEITGWVSAK